MTNIATIDKPIRFLLVGVGQRGKQWAQVVMREPDAELVACVEPEPAHQAWAVQTLNFPRAQIYKEFATALEAVEVDAVILAVPPMVRYEYSCILLERGLPIIAEKPLTMGFAETIDLTRRAQTTGVPLVSGFNFRYLNVTQTAKRMLASGAMGAPGMARYIYWLHRDGMKPGGNRYPLWMEHPMMLEQTIHHLDLFRYTYSSEVKWLWAKTHNPPWSRYSHDATAMILLEMESGMLVDYCGTWMGQSLVREFQWRTDCAEGALLQTDIYSELFMARAGEDAWQPVDVVPDVAYIDDTHALLKGVINDLANGRAPQPSAADNLRTVALVFACIESSATGEKIVMDEFYRKHGLTEQDLAL